MGVVPPAFASGDRKEMFAAIAAGDILIHLPYDSFASDGRGVHQRRRARSRLGRAEDDRVPHQRALAADPGADPGGRGGQAERVRRRAQGALRREPQHPLVAGAGGGGHPRRLRLPAPQGARQDDADRAPRGPRPAPLRPHRHRQLSRRHGAGVRGLRPVHVRRRHHRRRRRPVQPAHGLRPPAELPQAPGLALHAAPAAAGAVRVGGGRRPGRPARPHPHQGEQLHRRRDDRRPLRRVAGRRPGGHRRRAACARCGPASRA